MEYKKIEIVEEKKKKDTIEISKEQLVNIEDAVRNHDMYVGLPLKNSGETLDRKAIYLDTDYDWILGMWKLGLVCIPLKKEEEDQND